MKPEILERQIAHAGYLTVERLRMRLTDGAEVSREVERHGDAAAVLPYDVERRSALVVRLFRAPVLVAAGDEMSEEACAGMIENEDADTTARREVYEVVPSMTHGPMRPVRGRSIVSASRQFLAMNLFGVSESLWSPCSAPGRRCRQSYAFLIKCY